MFSVRRFLSCLTVKFHDCQLFQQRSLLSVFKVREEGLEAVNSGALLLNIAEIYFSSAGKPFSSKQLRTVV